MCSISQKVDESVALSPVAALGNCGTGLVNGLLNELSPFRKIDLKRIQNGTAITLDGYSESAEKVTHNSDKRIKQISLCLAEN